MMDIEKVREFLQGQTHMVLAVTLEDGTPWAVPVRIQKWQGREFEWDSRLDTVHSQAIAARPATAITLFQKAADAQIGFYASGRAELVEQKGEYGRYRFTVERAWLNDETFVKREVEI